MSKKLAIISKAADIFMVVFLFICFACLILLSLVYLKLCWKFFIEVI